MSQIEHNLLQDNAEWPILKCIIWDLDNTLWSGVLSEGDDIFVTESTRQTLEELDRRGLLQSVASRNSFDDAWKTLERLGLADYFVEPRISWNAKSEAVREIQFALNIGMDTIAFIDDQPFERAEVSHHLPEVRCYDASEAVALLGYAEFMPRFITSESAQRRAMYLQDKARADAVASASNQEAFTKSLELKVNISLGQRDDLERIEELTQRTNQLNASGYIYSFDELAGLMDSPRHMLLVVEAEDRFGSYGKIGAALVEISDRAWTLKLLLVSCRVMSRGVGGFFLGAICREARRRNLDLFAEYRQTDRNRAVLITLRFSGFVEHSALSEDGSLLRLDGLPAEPSSEHVHLTTPWD